MAEAANQNINNPNAEDQMDFGIQRLYLRDASLEGPNSPEIFKEDWNPKVEIDVQNKSRRLEESIYEVILTVTATVKLETKVAFIVEVHQAGIFTIYNFPEDQLQHLLGSFCPNIIFPYAREAITSLVAKGGFPQLYLSPINFDAIYQQQLQEKQTADEQQ